MSDFPPEYFEDLCQGKSWPLPRLTAHTSAKDKYDVVIVGAGPAATDLPIGLFLRLLLARYGLKDDSVVGLDPKSRVVQVGLADGFNARTMEVLATLGLEHFVVRRGRPFIDAVSCHLTPDGLQTQSLSRFDFMPSRFGQIHTQHQGQLEKILEEDLKNYSETGVQWKSIVTSVSIDESDPQYPVVVNVQAGNEQRILRSKFVIGADGAHSVVRKSMGIKMEGDIMDEIWGVMDFVPDSSFPDIRRMVRFMKDEITMAGFIVPREKLSDGNYFIRFYVGLREDTDTSDVIIDDAMREQARQRKAQVDQDTILRKCQELLHPYSLKVKEGTRPLWWTTYSVGQRLAESFIVEDSKSFPRVFLMGDACHSHSPRQGQGMNISTQDAYYLSWRLAYTILGLTPDSATLLRTYASERRPWAEKVVTSDKRWNQGTMPFADVWVEMKAQVTGVGIEEAPGLLVSERNDGVEWQGKDVGNGILRTGRRLFNVQVKRWADGTPVDIHDDFPSDGRYRILVLAGLDFPHGRSRIAVEQICGLTQKFKPGLVEAVFIMPRADADLSWSDMPGDLKVQAEMRLHCATETVYSTYSVSREDGAVALVRPDGIVAVTAGLDNSTLIKDMLLRVLVTNEHHTNGKIGKN